jgi:transposase
MTFHRQTVPPVPDATAAAALAVFRKGHPYLTLRDELGTIFTDAHFSEWFSPRGAPVEVPPWRLALVLILQQLETLTDRQAADNVRRCLDWKYLLSLELTDPGFDYTLLHDFRERILAQQAEQQLFDLVLDAFRARGLLQSRGKQRTDATHVLANVRTLNRIEVVGETLRHALDVLATVAPDWLEPQIQPEWLERYGMRFDGYRLPRKATERAALADRIGQDGAALLAALQVDDSVDWLGQVPAVITLRQVWQQQFVTADGRLRLRRDDELPPAAAQVVSPYDTDARWAQKRTTEWSGYTVHLTETVDDARPQLITHVVTTPATTSEARVTAQIHADLAARDLLPAEHFVDAAYVSADLVVTSQERHAVELVGPIPQDTSWQARQQTGYDLSQFTVNWEKQQVRCPQGKLNTMWRSSVDNRRGQPIILVQFAAADCQVCPVRPQCTTSRRQRSLKLRPQAHHETLTAARRAQTSSEFVQRYAQRAGIESTVSEATGRFALRHTPYRGLAKTHLRHMLTAIAINFVRLAAWLERPFGFQRSPTVSRFTRFATLRAA